jgi:serine/threonine protein kinase
VLLKPLAKGGMGEIYLAAGGEVGGFEKLCVIKKVITEKADRAKSKRFLDEAKVVLRLAHSALVTTFDAGDVAGEFYIAMELIEGKDLREVWNRCVRTRQRIPLDVALHVVREVARALAYVHRYGELKLVHRDVAPPNILLAYVGDVKLTDFGLARSVLKQEHTAPGVVFGRAAYLAPEQARGEVADARTDIYTLGIVLWELLTGQQFLQLSGLDPAAALAIVRNPKLVPPSTRAPWITPALDEVVMRALAANRQMRYQTADELRQGLSDVITDIAPRADASRVAEFLRTIYSDTIDEERVERDRFLKDLIPQFRAGPDSGEDAARPEGESAPTAGSPPAPSARMTPTAPLMAEPSGPVPATPAPPPMAASPRAPAVPVRLPGLPPTAPRPTLTRNGAPPARPAPVRPVELEYEEPPPPVELRPGPPARMVGGCRLGRSLIEGRLGSLHRAVRMSGNEDVSVRVLLGAAPDGASLERAREASRKLARLNHPNIASVAAVDIGEDGRVYTVLEPMTGVDLGTLLRNERRIDGTRALDIATQVARALAAAHAVGLVHGRVEPERILVNGTATGDQVKVLDFSVEARPPFETELSTVPYQAPEQIQGKAPDARSDVYAVAALLYEMVTGAPPHAGSSDPAARKLTEAVQSPRMFRPDMPVVVERFLLSSLDRDPERRPSTMHALEEGLLGLAKGVGAGPSPGTRPGGPQGGEERRKARREAAFQVIGELLAPGSALAAAEPIGLAGAQLQSAPPSGSYAGLEPPEPSFGGALLDRYGQPATERAGSLRKAYMLAVGGVVAVAAALAWRFFK